MCFKGRRKGYFSNFILLCVTIVILIFLTEVIFYGLNQLCAPKVKSAYPLLIDDEVTGYYNRPDSNLRVIKEFPDGRIVYDVTYTTDKYGRRVTAQKGRSDSHIIFFGGSFVFGIGLNNNETLPYYLSKITSHSVYNYSCSGFGPNMVFAQLQRENFTDEIEEKKGLAIYVFIDNHVRRVIGDIFIDDRAPYLYLDPKDNLARKGSFATGQRPKRLVYDLIRSSQVFRYFKIEIPFLITDKDIYLTSRLIKASADAYKSRFDGTFYVLIYPQSRIYTKKLMKLLASYDIPILDYSMLLKERDENKFYIENDNHPNSLLNKILAEEIAGQLRLPKD